MGEFVEKHSTGVLFSLVLVFATGYLDMRNLVSQGLYKIEDVEKKVDTVTTIAVTTRTEQLLRTDEIDAVKKLRDKHPELFRDD